ncbi:DedA family protein [Pseudonocardia sp. TRM90224]|uniref:DedA family protein n=1 Tax=Pseudonocardia sp. TRM90224 TaxID=2812678 RepID=UPI0027DF8886|nr:DedA family protein [Pseudonocardia sp. TRM90224]
MIAATPPVPVPPPDGIVGWVVGLMDALGAPGVGLAIALENIFPPLPSEVFLPLAGFAAARGEMSIIAAIAWTTAGSVVGALVLYAIGAVLGRDRLRAIVDRMPLVNLRDVDKAEEWFARHGAKAVFLGRMVPLVRSAISVPAGVERMPPLLFVALTAAGSLIWNTVFVLAGYFLGENWHIVEQYAGILSKIVLGLLVLAVAVVVVRRVLARRRAAEAEETDDEPETSDESGESDETDEAPTEKIPAVAVWDGADDPTLRYPVQRPVQHGRPPHRPLPQRPAHQRPVHQRPIPHSPPPRPVQHDPRGPVPPRPAPRHSHQPHHPPQPQQPPVRRPPA